MLPNLRTLTLAGLVALGGLLGTGAGEAKAQLVVSTPGFTLGLGAVPAVGVYPAYPVVPAPVLAPAYGVYPVRPYPYVYGPRAYYGPRPYGPYYGPHGYYRRW